MNKRILSDKENWLAAEYALGVLDEKAKAKAESKYENKIAFRHTVDEWHIQFEPFLDDVAEIMPNKTVWKNIDLAINGGANSQADNPIGLWKLMTALASTTAVAAIGALMFITGGDFTGQQVKSLEQELASAKTTIETVNQQAVSTKTQLLENTTKLTQTETVVEQTRAQLATVQNELSQTNDQLAVAQSELVQKNEQLALAQNDLSQKTTELASTTDNANDTLNQLASTKDELASTRNQLASAQAEVSEIRRAIDESKPLVASLSQSGDAPAFIAQYDPLKGSLLIRTAIEDETEKVPEIWLIPSGGPREGDVLSLGVMNENAPEEVKLGEEFSPLLTEGGTLAITMEPPGGAPEGIPTGPIIALGKLQALN